MADTFENRLVRLEQAQRELDDFVLGQWDFKTNTRTPGLAERLDNITAQVNTLIKLLKWGVLPLLAASFTVNAGSHVQEIIPIAVKVAASLIGTH